MSDTLTRADIAEVIFRKLGFSQIECSELVDGFFEEITEALEHQEEVKLSSFGSFRVRHKNPRIGRNPKTKEEVMIPARKVVSFHASNVLVDKVNGE